MTPTPAPLFRLFFFLAFLSVTAPSGAQVMISRPAADSFLTDFYEQLLRRHTFAQHEPVRKAIGDSLTVSRRELLAWPRDSVALYVAFRLVDRLRAATGDGHLSLDPVRTSAYERATSRTVRALPFYPLTDGRVVSRYSFTYRGDTIPAGSLLLRYNGRPVGPLLEDLSYLLGFNDNNYRRPQLRRAAWVLPRLYTDFYGPVDSIRLDMVIAGQPRLLTLASVTAAPPRDSPPPGGKGVSAPKNRNDRRTKPRRSSWPFSSGWSADSTYWHLKIGSFNERNYKGKGLRPRLRRAFRDLSAAGADKLLIDVRGNGGGQVSRGAALLSYFIDREWQKLATAVSYSPQAHPPNPFVAAGYWLYGMRKKGGVYHQQRLTRAHRPVRPARRFTGRVVILIDEYSFSTTTLFAAWAKKHRVATLVGEVSGGNPNLTFGGIFRNEPVRVAGRTYNLRMGSYRFAADLAPEQNLQPDVYVPIRQEDLAAGRDAQLANAIEILLGEDAGVGAGPAGKVGGKTTNPKLTTVPTGGLR